MLGTTDDREATVEDIDGLGTLRITCARGHSQTISPAILYRDENGTLRRTYGSDADFCNECERDPDYHGSSRLVW